MAKKAETFEETVLAANVGDIESINLLGEYTDGTGLTIEDVGYSPIRSHSSIQSSPDLKVPLITRLGGPSKKSKKK